MARFNLAWLMTKKRVKLRALAIVVGMSLALTFSFDVKAFRPNTRPWLNSNTTYIKTTALTNQPGFGAATDAAANNWSSQTLFVYNSDPSSANKVDYYRPPAPYQNALMVTYSWWDPDMYRDKIEIVVNNTTDTAAIKWYTGSGTPPPNNYSFQSIMTHEMGHGAGLGHVPTGTLLMFPSFAAQEVRSIAQDEKDGIRFLYDSANSNFHPAGQEPWGAQGGLNDDRSKFIGYTGQGWVFGTPLWSNFSTLAWSNSPGSKTWGEFSGSTLTWGFTKHNLRGPAEVYIDGTWQATINLYSADTVWRAKRTWDVSPGAHVIEVRHVGTASQYIDVDSFQADKTLYGVGTYDDTAGGIEYIGYWTHNSICCPSAYNGTLSWSNSQFDNANFTFRGKGITYYYTKAYNRGTVSIYIDGLFMEEMDLYSPTIQWQQSKRWALPQGPHTINVVVTHRKNAAAADYYVDVDKFVPD